MKTLIDHKFYEVTADTAVIYNGAAIPITDDGNQNWRIVVDNGIILLTTFEVDGVLWCFSTDLQEMAISQFVTEQLPETGMAYTEIEWFKTLPDPVEEWTYHIFFKLKGAENYRSGWRQADSEAALIELLQNPEYIGLEDGTGEWLCLCANVAFDDGFYTCDTQGEEMEPLIGSDWKGLYACAACGRIINGDTRKVVGHK
ncbi:hypothetical protein [Mucilaginibacter sp.]|jgi:hypothetical protein|uniref:hypothetical protein n=1 Tax=Mucilaginibacter sp. TaxID=1882438 RepID=UPI00356A9973